MTQLLVMLVSAACVFPDATLPPYSYRSAYAAWKRLNVWDISLVTQ